MSLRKELTEYFNYPSCPGLSRRVGSSAALPLGVGRLLGAKPGRPGLVAFVTQGCMAAYLGKDKLVELIQWSDGSHINIIMSKNQGEK